MQKTTEHFKPHPLILEINLCEAPSELPVEGAARFFAA